MVEFPHRSTSTIVSNIVIKFDSMIVISLLIDELDKRAIFSIMDNMSVFPTTIDSSDLVTVRKSCLSIVYRKRYKTDHFWIIPCYQHASINPPTKAWSYKKRFSWLFERCYSWTMIIDLTIRIDIHDSFFLIFLVCIVLAVIPAQAGIFVFIQKISQKMDSSLR